MLHTSLAVLSPVMAVAERMSSSNPRCKRTSRTAAAGRVQAMFTAVALVVMVVVTIDRVTNSAAIWDGGIGLYLPALTVGLGWLAAMSVTVWMAPLRSTATSLLVMAVALNSVGLTERLADTGGLVMEVRLSAVCALGIWLMWATWSSILARIEADRVAWILGATAFALLIAVFFVVPPLRGLWVD